MELSTLDALIELAFKEDLGTLGDITSTAIFSTQTGTARLISREEGILAGADIPSRVYALLDKSLQVTFNCSDGENLSKGQEIADIRGNVRSILMGERTVLNFLSYLSGIATETHRYVETASLAGRALILDTRKTLPGYRELAKYAVVLGNGRNHRMGLYDMVMIKDNHIDAAGSITGAVEKVQEKWGTRFTIEVECRTEAEVKEALECGVDIIMLDNMSEEQVRSSIELKGGNVTFEASGDMDIEKVKRYSALGVDYISVGKLTHSVKAFNFSLLMEL